MLTRQYDTQVDDEQTSQSTKRIPSYPLHNFSLFFWVWSTLSTHRIVMLDDGDVDNVWSTNDPGTMIHELEKNYARGDCGRGNDEDNDNNQLLQPIRSGQEQLI